MIQYVYLDFYLSEIESESLTVEKGTTFWKNVTECHTSAETAACQIQSPSTQLNIIL